MPCTGPRQVKPSLVNKPIDLKLVLRITHWQVSNLAGLNASIRTSMAWVAMPRPSYCGANLISWMYS